MGFYEFYNMWRQNPIVKVWQNTTNWVILEFRQEDEIYHASFMMETKSFKLYKMKEFPWVNGMGVGLEIDKEV